MKQNNQNAVVFVYNDDLNAIPMKINLQTREKPTNLNMQNLITSVVGAISKLFTLGIMGNLSFGTQLFRVEHVDVDVFHHKYTCNLFFS